MNELYVSTGSYWLFGASSLSPDKIIDAATYTGNGSNVWLSDQLDLGPTPRPLLYRWDCSVDLGGSSGEAVSLFAVTAPDHDSTQIDGKGLTASNASLGTTYYPKNVGAPFGVVGGYSYLTDIQEGSGVVELPARYFSLLVHIAGAVASTGGLFRFRLYPYSLVGQV